MIHYLSIAVIFTDFISMNRDFQEFVALVAHTVNSQTSSASAGPLSVSEVLQLQPIWWSGASNAEPRGRRALTLQEMLADIISSIRSGCITERQLNDSMTYMYVVYMYMHVMFTLSNNYINIVSSYNIVEVKFNRY